MAERYVRNLTYPQGYERSENAINDYYNTRELELQAQYESRVRDIDTRLYENDEEIQTIQEYYFDNQELVKERADLLKEYERSTTAITELEQQYENKNTRYQALDNLWSQTPDPAERDRIKQEAIEVYNERERIADEIRRAKDSNKTDYRDYAEKDREIVQKIDGNNVKISKLRNLEGKQQKLVEKQKRYSNQLDRDLEKNEIARENALKNVNVPVLNTRVKKYVSGPVSKNRDRIVALPLVVSIDYPEGENPREIPEEVLADLGIELFDMVGADYVTPNPSLMQITDSIPSAKDVYDYESSQYAQDFASNVVFFDYGVYLDYTRLPDGKHYAPPRE
jgi:hypothetical protein